MFLIFIVLVVLLVEYQVAGFSTSSFLSQCTRSRSSRRVCSATALAFRPSTLHHNNIICGVIHQREATYVRSSSDGSETSQESQIDQDSNLVAKQGSTPQGYMSSDLSSMEDGKKGRVLAYILIALLPCLGLVPFILNRDFVPPVELMSN